MKKINFKKVDFKKYHLIRDFFSEQQVNYPVLMSVIEENNPGDIFLDNFTCPSICLVIAAGGYTFIGHKKDLVDESISQIVSILKNYSLIKVVVENNWPYQLAFKCNGFESVERVQFSHPEIEGSLTGKFDDICKCLPENFQVRTIDKQILEQSPWQHYIEMFFGNGKQFFNKGFGLALCNNQKVVSEAYALFNGGGYIETGSVTHPGFEKKGYATLIRAFLIKEILKKHLKPASSCNLDNPGSYKSSIKLGFEEKTHYQFLVYMH